MISTAAPAAGYAADQLLGDPARWHPVAGFGRLAGGLECVMWAPRRARGVAFAALLVGGVVVAVALVERRLRGPLRAAFTAAVVWCSLGSRSLTGVAEQIAVALEGGDLARARSIAPSLVGREPSRLDERGVARATVESVAENTSDAVVAPLLWAALGGAPAAAAYRAVNTLDAIVGNRSPRHREFGWAAARLDDVANLVPARITALLAIAWAPAFGGSVRAAWVGAFVHGRTHPSPNAGRVEGAFAGALSLRLGGRTVYLHDAEDRPALGTGSPPGIGDIRRAANLSRVVAVSAALLATRLAAARPR